MVYCFLCRGNMPFWTLLPVRWIVSIMLSFTLLWFSWELRINILWRSWDPDYQSPVTRALKNSTTMRWSLRNYGLIYLQVWHMHVNSMSTFTKKHWTVLFMQCSSFAFTATITLTGADMWYKKLRETIDKQQQLSIWVSESKVRFLVLLILSLFLIKCIFLCSI